jgi:hypothetical protein
MIVVIGLVLTLVGHWAVSQSVAWVTMVVKYSRTTTFKAALIMTFDGQHPCELCEFVSEGRKADAQKPQHLLKAHSLDLFVEKPAVFLFLKPELPHADAADRAVALRSEPPPTPPPRAA